MNRREFLRAGVAAVASAAAVGLSPVQAAGKKTDWRAWLLGKVRRRQIRVDPASGPDKTVGAMFHVKQAPTRYRGAFSTLGGQEIQRGDVVYHAGRFFCYDPVEVERGVRFWHFMNREEVGEMDSPWVQHVYDNPISHPEEDLEDLYNLRPVAAAIGRMDKAVYVLPRPWIGEERPWVSPPLVDPEGS